MFDHLAPLRPSELPPAERSAVVAALLAAGLRPAALPPPASDTN